VKKCLFLMSLPYFIPYYLMVREVLVGRDIEIYTNWSYTNTTEFTAASIPLWSSVVLIIVWLLATVRFFWLCKKRFQ